MWTYLKWFGFLVLAIIAAAAGIYFSGNTLNVIVWLSGPPKNWDLARKAPDPPKYMLAIMASRASGGGERSVVL
jgi:hypothetical protein